MMEDQKNLLRRQWKRKMFSLVKQQQVNLNWKTMIQQTTQQQQQQQQNQLCGLPIRLYSN